MKKNRIALSLLMMAAALLSSCARTPELTLNLSVDTRDSAVIEDVHRILLFRFGEFRPSFFSSIASRIEGSVISFRFKGGAPEDRILKYLYETPGKVRASLTDSSAELFTDLDIEGVALAYENQTYVLGLRLKQAAGERVFALTSQNVGKKARLALDDQPLFDATIFGAFRDSFQITSSEQDIENATALTVVLKSGALPARVSLAER